MLTLYTTRVAKIENGIVRVIAGGGALRPASGLRATDVSLANPQGIAVSADGTLFISDRTRCEVYRVGADGILTVLAGDGTAGFSGDGGPASAARLSAPTDMAVDASGNLYVADMGNNRVRRITAAGIISTYAGNGSAAESGSGVQATAAGVSPRFLAVDGAGQLYVASSGTVRRVNAQGVIETVAGGGTTTQENVAPTQARFANIWGFGIAADGRIYVSIWTAVAGMSRIRTVPPGGNVTTIAGGATRGATGDGAAAAAAVAGEGGPLAASQLRQLYAVTRHAQGNFYLADRLTHSVYRTDPDLNNLRRIAGTGYPGYSREAGAALQMAFAYPMDVEVDAAGNVYISDGGNSRVRRVTPAGQLTTFAGTDYENGLAFANGMQATRCYMGPWGLHLAPGGDLYVTDVENDRVVRVTPGGTLHGVAGNGTGGFSGDGGQASAAAMYRPTDLRIDADGAILFVDNGNGRVRRIGTDGIISTIAGGGSGFGDNYEATGVALVSGTGQIESATFHLEPGRTLWVSTLPRLIRMDIARLFVNWVYNCASFVSGPVAPGECFAFYGDDIGPASLVSAAYSADGNLARTVADTQVLVNGSPVPLIFVSKDFNAALMPYGISGTVTLEVHRPPRREQPSS